MQDIGLNWRIGLNWTAAEDALRGCATFGPTVAN